MDKIAANNHFVVLKKEIKKAKAMVCGNLIRKINKHKQEKEKVDDDTDGAKAKKIDEKIANIYEETKLIKTLDSYSIAKKATLKPDPGYWDKLISDSKATADERLSARVIIKNNVQKQVKKFRSDHIDCDEWLNEYIEFREKKREIKESAGKPRHDLAKKAARQNKQADYRNDSPKRQQDALGRERGNRFRRTQLDESKGKRSREEDAPINNDIAIQNESLHPSWEVKRKQKELLKAALSDETCKPKKIVFSD